MASDALCDNLNEVNGVPIGKPCKFFVTDLVASKLLPNGMWQLNVSIKDKTNLSTTSTIPLVHDGTVWIQGLIVQTAASNSIIILEDETGKAKITNCSTILGALTWLKKGAYCLAIGKLLDVPGIPTIAAMKLISLDVNSVFQEMWKEEVEEIKYLLTNQLTINV